MKRIILFVAISVFSLSCNQSGKETEAPADTPAGQADPVADTPVPAPEDLTPDVTTGLPKANRGCSYYFTYDSLALNKGSYVFVQQMEAEKGFLQIDGKTLTLDLVEHTEPEPGKKQQIFSSGQFKVILTTQEVKQPGKGIGTYFKGTLEIYKDVSERKLKVHGKVLCEVDRY